MSNPLMRPSLLPIGSAPISSTPRCERVVIRAGNGRVYDLGSPDSRLFKLRVWIYRFRRRKEFSACK